MAAKAASDTSLAMYLKEIDQYKLLTREDEERLGRLVGQGDSAARDTMIRSNLRLVVRIAREFCHRGVPMADLVAEGNIGLMKAVERFNPEEGTRFSTYAIWWIRQTIRRALQTNGPTVRVPGYMVELVSRWKRANEQLTAQYGRAPTPEELAKALDISPKRIAVIRRALRAASTAPKSSPDMMWLFEDVLVDEKHKAPDDRLAEEGEHQMVQRCLAAIDEREAELLRLRYGLDSGEPKTLQEIGAKMGVTRERVRQLEAEALRKLARSIWRYEHGVPPEQPGEPEEKPRAKPKEIAAKRASASAARAAAKLKPKPKKEAKKR
ncbi:MAG TPA: RNA polymerase sigma factor RpoD/SigA [Candidatus Brocadiia bacterium]|mgnify:CR=1 FL=1|nr:RNA polymerase sigma factor RpoD/SigA [Candidatus Brocadiia bacterium]